MDDVQRMLIARLDRIEHKVDKVLEFRWKLAGALTAITVFCSLGGSALITLVAK